MANRALPLNKESHALTDTSFRLKDRDGKANDIATMSDGASYYFYDYCYNAAEAMQVLSYRIKETRDGTREAWACPGNMTRCFTQ